MAGSFGFEKEHYDVSIKVDERVLLPAVREAAKETLIIADGFSCREQIAQATDRRAVHLAEALQLALEGSTHVGRFVEDACLPARHQERLPAAVGAAAALVAIGAILAVISFRR